MATSDFQQALDRIDAQIAELQRAKAILLAAVPKKAAIGRKPKAVPRPTEQAG